MRVNDNPVHCVVHVPSTSLLRPRQRLWHWMLSWLQETPWLLPLQQETDLQINPQHMEGQCLVQFRHVLEARLQFGSRVRSASVTSAGLHRQGRAYRNGGDLLAVFPGSGEPLGFQSACWCCFAAVHAGVQCTRVGSILNRLVYIVVISA